LRRASQPALLATVLRLGFTNAEYFGSACRTHTLSSRAAVLHCNSLRVFDINLLPTLNTIRLHFDLLN